MWFVKSKLAKLDRRQRRIDELQSRLNMEIGRANLQLRLAERRKGKRSTESAIYRDALESLRICQHMLSDEQYDVSKERCAINM